MSAGSYDNSDDGTSYFDWPVFMGFENGFGLALLHFELGESGSEFCGRWIIPISDFWKCLFWFSKARTRGCFGNVFKSIQFFLQSNYFLVRHFKSVTGLINVLAQSVPPVLL
jgi:hypothetical protein